MATKRDKVYTEAEKAEVLAVFVNNGKNVKKTCRDYVEAGGSLTPQTLRRWWRDFEKNPDAYPVISSVIQTSTEEYIEHATSIVNNGAELIDRNIQRMLAEDKELSVADMTKLATTVGITLDKLRLSRGEATKRTENTSTLVSVTSEDLASAITANIASALEEGRKRDEEVIQIEAEIAEAQLVDEETF